jgi:anti-sigma factor RsiW
MTYDPLFNCVRALHDLLLYIDNELADLNERLALENHLATCQPCHSEMEHEKAVVLHLKQALSKECQESAPSELNNRIAEQTAALAAQMNAMSGPQIITEIRTTETTIIGDTVIEIETHEIRRDFPPLN